MDTQFINDFQNIPSKADFDSMSAMFNLLIYEKESFSCHTCKTLRLSMLFLALNMGYNHTTIYKERFYANVH